MTSMILSALLVLTFVTPTSEPAASLAEWSECLLEYAQVQSSTADTEVTIAVHGLAQCQDQKDRYRQTLMLNFQAQPTPSISTIDLTNAKLEYEESEIAARTIAFVRSVRQK
jgi:hypothetical protein